MIEKVKKPTVKDVAALAGVSATTVSLVINGKGSSIPELTHDRVRRARKTICTISACSRGATWTG